MALLDNGPVLLDVELQTRTRVLSEFLDSSSPHYNYKDDIARLLRRDEARLIVNVDDLRDYNREYADGLLKKPIDFLPAFDAALTQVIKLVVSDPEKHDVDAKEYKVGLSGSFGDHHVNPRTLRASHLSKMISLEGIVTRCSLVRPKMIKSIHYCAATTFFHQREYRDATSSSVLPPTSTVTPQVDEDGHPLQTEFGMCTFRDHQRISIQEMPERAPAGQLPRSIDVIMDEDLVDRCKPGDRIQLVGIYRSMGGGASGTFRRASGPSLMAALINSSTGPLFWPTTSTSSLPKLEAALRRCLSRTPTFAPLTNCLSGKTYFTFFLNPSPRLYTAINKSSRPS